MEAMIRSVALALLVFGGWCFGASPLAVGPRRHAGLDIEEARRPGRLSLPSRQALLRTPSVHRLSRVTRDELQLLKPKSGTTAIGRHRQLSATALNEGQWDTLPNGAPVWRMAIQSPAALGIRLHFSGFSAGAGRVWIHDGSTELSQIAGPYAGMGPYHDGDFWSDTLMSETVIVEYQPANPTHAQWAPPFQITELSHVFADPQPTAKEDLSKAAAASCNLDSTCYSEWADTAKAVARISFESGGGSFVCSGTLLNNRANSGDLLFLTANHCIDTDTVARTLQTFWFYQTSTCNGAVPSTRNVPRTAGSRLLVTGDRTQGDFSLVRLESVPNGVMFSGWDPAEVAEGTALTVVHHPSGDYKRIAFGNRVASSRISSAFYSVLYSQGLTEGGSSGSGLFSAPLMLTGTLSNGPKADTPEQYCRLIPFADNFGRFSAYYPQLRDILEGRSASSRDLVSGVPAQVSLDAVTGPTLFTGDFSYRIVVPQGATRLDVTLATATANANVDLFVRYASDNAVTSGAITTDHRAETAGGNEQISITATSTPPLRAGTYFVSLAVRTVNVAVRATLTATVTTAASSAPTVLTSGVSRAFSLPAAEEGTLFNGGRSFTITVPQGATRLDIVLVTSTPRVDIDLFARFGQDVTVQNGRVSADFGSDGLSGNERITITSATTPALRPGTYFISLMSFTAGAPAVGTVTATVSSGPVTAPSQGPIQLTSGVRQPYSYAAVSQPTLFFGRDSFYIDVPEGATRLDIQLTTSTFEADVDLYVRHGSDTDVQNGEVVADFNSTGPDGNERITITPDSTPALRSGRYFISLVLYSTDIAAAGSLMATVTGGGTTVPTPTSPTQLTAGTPARFALPAVDTATLYYGNYSFKVEVPENSTQLRIELKSDNPNVDVDLYARYGADTDLLDNDVVADYRSEGTTGNETITITSASSPPLRPGTYYISLGLFSKGVPSTGTITATIERAAQQTSQAREITSGTPVNYVLSPSSGYTLYAGPNSYRITVGPQHTRLAIALRNNPADVDVDLYVRFGQEPAVNSAGRVEADFRSLGDFGTEDVVITTPTLRPGDYYISIALFQSSREARGTLTATLSSGGTSDEPELSSAKKTGESRKGTASVDMLRMEKTSRPIIGVSQ